MQARVKHSPPITAHTRMQAPYYDVDVTSQYTSVSQPEMSCIAAAETAAAMVTGAWQQHGVMSLHEASCDVLVDVSAAAAALTAGNADWRHLPPRLQRTTIRRTSPTLNHRPPPPPPAVTSSRRRCASSTPRAVHVDSDCSSMRRYVAPPRFRTAH